MAENSVEERLGELMALAEETFGNREKAEKWMGRRSRVLKAVPAELGRSEEGSKRVRAELSAIAHGDVV